MDEQTDEQWSPDGSADVVDITSPATPRRPLDQMRILRAAVDFIDENGLPKLTMRRLGGYLGVEAMALYRYVPGRERLLDGVVEVVMDEFYTTTAAVGRSTSWPEFLQMNAHAVRELALRHPRIFPLVATRPAAAPWLRPPLRSLRWVEGFLEGLRAYGFSPAACVQIYRSFATFLLGALQLEVGTLEQTGASDRDRVNLAFIESDDLSSYPMITQMSEELKDGGFEQDFEDALEDLIGRVGVLRS
ncbi:MAG: TetR/AcrR family transcriptional regulator C-terminal domain-containing protein [Microlunatus sp.]|nr:TetR/AcrR family transcriptional regulator C-terminal domain-containing protein [Microlunatus sp.]MDN5770135.1 TetR/AcrR family transcriptional regulator C-terminal domain-containing protein [Microlunatus sp.]